MFVATSPGGRACCPGIDAAPVEVVQRPVVRVAAEPSSSLRRCPSEEGFGMKQIAIGCIVAAVVLSGCTVKETVVRPVETRPAVVYEQAPGTERAPRIAYAVVTETQANQAAAQAATWCNTNHYGPGARLIDRRRSMSGDVVTFECSPS